MKWAHLPMAGGLYDQHPVLVDRFYYILAERSKEQAKEANKNKETGPASSHNRMGISRPRGSR